MEKHRWVSPIGTSVEEASRRRASRSSRYRRQLEHLEPFERLARSLIRLRMDLDLTQQQLADKTGTTASAIARLESGRHRPNVETLKKIANAYGGHLLLGFDIPARRGGQPLRELVSL